MASDSDSTRQRRPKSGAGGSNNQDDVQPTSTTTPRARSNSLTARLSRSPSVQKLKKVTRKKWSNKWVFLLGGLFGAGFAMYYAKDSFELRLPDGAMAEFFDDMGAYLPQSVIQEAQKLSARRAESATGDSFAAGRKLLKQGYELQYPTVMVPGVISTGLESWVTEGPAAPYYRKRLWGSWNMIRAMLSDKAYWSKAIALDPVTGLDPECCKLRPAAGFDASDFFITGYWIWNKILENLSVIGGDPTNMYTASYDWRLSFANLEYRDGYFSRLKMHIETAKRLKGRKVVLVTHSMGSQVLFYFFKWVEAEGEDFGNGGSSWVEDHVDSWVNISGSMLGAPKTVAALISGEMKDTAQLNALAVYGLETFFSKKERAAILRTMPGISSMLPKGGNRVWGDHSGAPDDPENLNGTSYGTFIKFKQDPSSISPDKSAVINDNMTMSDSFDYLLQHTSHNFHRMLASNYSHGVALTSSEVRGNDGRPEKWVNPLEASLPHAPGLKIYCFYGVGKPTERTYYYADRELDNAPTKLKSDMVESDDTSRHPDLQNTTVKGPLDIPFVRNGQIDASVTIRSDTDHGVQMGEGDGTVSLLSSGYMCARGWRQISRYNPGGAKITTVEMAHEEDVFDIRGGPKTADHVDILGRPELSELIGKVVAGKGHEIQDKYVSDIRKYAAKVDVPL